MAKKNDDDNLRQPDLFNAIKNGNLSEIESKLQELKNSEKLLNKYINQQRKCDGYTLLHCAVEANKYEIARILLKYRANPNLESKTEKTAIKLSKILPKRDSNFKILFFLLGHDNEDCIKENIIEIIPKKDNITPNLGLLRATRQDNKSNTAKLNLDNLFDTTNDSNVSDNLDLNLIGNQNANDYVFNEENV